ncbi:MAG: helix-turn-helix domain-containing protein [Chitinispirillales bacterium]|jgi:transcriptional regulator with XRE-family HTH domain|nr:helix-turn-helix domain-containing protein [Chitinispirillales bacterium]
MNWGETLLKIRETLGLTQGELAEKLGVTQVGVSKIESKLRSPSVKLKSTIKKFMAENGMNSETVIASPSESTDTSRLWSTIKSQQAMLQSQQRTIEALSKSVENLSDKKTGTDVRALVHNSKGAVKA